MQHLSESARDRKVARRSQRDSERTYEPQLDRSDATETSWERKVTRRREGTRIVEKETITVKYRY